ncbi:ImmA/IrrE family metallo-endopeptidase [Lactobacillus crispatus]|uniref:ImmA/IrrE family metallo-endopeptidase n=1 Tax=Lactobacillus crispatus TaxID=47770 RepID=UPI0022AC1F21|nr:ImmA/IrrE family metallo-endopeptidase [Lactobacillus crispatus]MCZ3642187.1 ImmA/IrrE family metallo-endopeptidase [Lactobacillus crispatus]MCZ3644535.1 ImmA/IrrE family metallo-endopeptidase [Lactobacillus crispatus]MCZ3647058.1 ImmA/IrrE family metallo-endopeptidase [Lactobacillus crispatus]MCZ3649462.1 ImmA/IrrE family metallo-endopeptidase [Lactobacillus crispatus]MCZ3651802.1 ImmA/IrrE family metallo-endopeptidase [Lactobacillus crispatus]
MNEVITWLMNYCMDHDIGIIYKKNLPQTAPSDSWHNPKLIIFNANFYKKFERPFMLAHEIGHVVEEVPEYYKLAYLGIEKGEFSANRFAINLLSLYCMENDIWYETYYDFAQAFGIPKDKYYVLEVVFGSLNKVY